ncbi:hypothetical protein ACLB2K_048461 [Fragaria x ananassa]
MIAMLQAFSGQIVILVSDPSVEMGEILAHEMMHAWIHLQGVPRGCCEPSTEEGVCQVMSYKWLQWFSSSGFDNSHKTDKQVQHTRELKELLVERIRCQDDEVYGPGFRDTMRAIETFGFQPILDHIIKYRTLQQHMKDSTCSAEVYNVRRFINDIRAIGTNLDHVVQNRTLAHIQPMMDSTWSTVAAADELVRKNSSATPQPDKVLCKASCDTTESFWKATVATTINFIWKAATSCETRIILGHSEDMLSAIVSVFIVFEHG